MPLANAEDGSVPRQYSFGTEVYNNANKKDRYGIKEFDSEERREREKEFSSEKELGRKEELSSKEEFSSKDHFYKEGIDGG